jgi:hypothetical protein
MKKLIVFLIFFIAMTVSANLNSPPRNIELQYFPKKNFINNPGAEGGIVGWTISDQGTFSAYTAADGSSTYARTGNAAFNFNPDSAADYVQSSSWANRTKNDGFEAQATCYFKAAESDFVMHVWNVTANSSVDSETITSSDDFTRWTILFSASETVSYAIRMVAADGTSDLFIDDCYLGEAFDAGILAGTNGGTGVSNAGDLTYGSNDITFTTTGATSVTLPTTGTLATTADIAAAGTSSSYDLKNLGLSAAVAANALTINLETADGSTDPSGGSPVSVGFRSSTADSGAYNVRTATAATSITISSGSTLGHASAVAHYIYVYAIDNAGTIELAVSSVMFDDGTRITTTAEGGAGAADSRAAIYSTTARTDVPLRMIGRLLVTEATAGTWATAPSEVSLVPFNIKPIIALYSSNNGATLEAAGGGEKIIYEDKEIDTHNAYDTGTGDFTSPITGYCTVNASISIADAAWTAGNLGDLKLRNDTTSKCSDFIEVQASVTMLQTYNCSRTVAVTAGDPINIFFDHNRGGGDITLATTTSYNQLSIHCFK